MTDTNVFPLSQPGTFADPLTEVLRHGARALLAQAVETEVAALLSCRTDKLTNDGRPSLVRQPRCSRVFNKGDVIRGPIYVGFDFRIGLPTAYAERTTLRWPKIPRVSASL